MYSKKFLKGIIAFAIVVLLILLSSTLCVKFFSSDSANSKSTVYHSEAFNSPQECYLKALKSYDAIVKDHKNNRYGKSLYVSDTKTQYFEVFQTKNDYDVWIFVLDKKESNGLTRYYINDYSNNVQLAKYDWEDIDGYSYRVFDDETELKKYNLNVSDSTEFEIKTVNGKETLYFVMK